MFAEITADIRSALTHMSDQIVDPVCIVEKPPDLLPFKELEGDAFLLQLDGCRYACRSGPYNSDSSSFDDITSPNPSEIVLREARCLCSVPVAVPSAMK